VLAGKKVNFRAKGHGMPCPYSPKTAATIHRSCFRKGLPA
jgi:hypothetical protein